MRSPLIKQGWLRALICVLGVSLVLRFISIYAHLVQQLAPTAAGENESILRFGIFYSLVAAGTLLFVWLLRTQVDRQSFSSLGFARTGYGNEAGLGFFTAVALLGIGSLILIVPGYLIFSGANMQAGSLPGEVLIMAIVAFTEETLFRGYLLGNLLQSMGKWIALVITAALFALSHLSNPDITVFAIVNIFLAGLLLGLNYIFTRNLWFGIFYHFAWNFFQGPILGFNVSGLQLHPVLQQSLAGPEIWTGGAFGFEGSLLCPLLTTVAIFGLGFVFMRRYAT